MAVAFLVSFPSFSFSPRLLTSCIWKFKIGILQFYFKACILPLTPPRLINSYNAICHVASAEKPRKQITRQSIIRPAGLRESGQTYTHIFSLRLLRSVPLAKRKIYLDLIATHPLFISYLTFISSPWRWCPVERYWRTTPPPPPFAIFGRGTCITHLVAIAQTCKESCWTIQQLIKGA